MVPDFGLSHQFYKKSVSGHGLWTVSLAVFERSVDWSQILDCLIVYVSEILIALFFTNDLVTL